MIEEKKLRIDEIDIIKSLGIILMVSGHSGAPFTRFIYLFHMSIFFIASGFCFKEKHSQSIRNVFLYIFSRIKSLWIPFFVWNTIYILLHNFFLNINIYSNNPDFLVFFNDRGRLQESYTLLVQLKKILKSVLFLNAEQLAGAFWFFGTIFFVSCSYCFADFLLKRVFSKKKIVLISQGIISVFLLLIGYYCSLRDLKLFNLPRVASCYILYFIGYFLSNFKEKYMKYNNIFYIVFCLISFFSLTILNNLGSINLDINSYGNPIFLLMCSLFGWTFLFSLSFFIKKIILLKNVLVYIGQRTVSVVILHFLAMKIVALIIISIYDLPDYCLAAFPSLYGNKGVWWIAYTIAGVSIPVLLNAGYQRIRKN